MKQILFKVHYIKREMNKIINKNMFHLIALFHTYAYILFISIYFITYFGLLWRVIFVEDLSDYTVALMKKSKKKDL